MTCPVVFTASVLTHVLMSVLSILEPNVKPSDIGLLAGVRMLDNLGSDAFPRKKLLPTLLPVRNASQNTQQTGNRWIIKDI